MLALYFVDSIFSDLNKVWFSDFDFLSLSGYKKMKSEQIFNKKLLKISFQNPYLRVCVS